MEGPDAAGATAHPVDVCALPAGERSAKKLSAPASRTSASRVGKAALVAQASTICQDPGVAPSGSYRRHGFGVYRHGNSTLL